MKARSGLIIPLLAILVGTCMIVTAVGIVRVSNVAERNNQVSDVSSLVHIEIQPPTGGTSWVNGSALIGTTYSCKVYWSTTAAINQASVVVLFQKSPLINVTDVSMSYVQLPGAVWSVVTFSPSTSDSIRGVVGTSGFAMGSSESATYAIELTYNVPGDYDFQLYVEGIPA